MDPALQLRSFCGQGQVGTFNTISAHATMSLECLSCHHKNFVDSEFCNQCGTRLFTDCSLCGWANIQESKFCSKCGGLTKYEKERRRFRNQQWAERDRRDEEAKKRRK